MTQKANPSVNRPAEAFKTAGAIAHGGAQDGYVVDGASPTQIAVQDSGISESDLNSFAESHSSSSFDVTIDPGEAFVFGTWLAKDTITTVTLDSLTNGQTVHVGWNKNGSDDVIIGTPGDFSASSGDTDMKIPLWDFDTDSSGITSTTDRRLLGQPVNVTNSNVSISLGGESLDVYRDGPVEVTGANLNVTDGNVSVQGDSVLRNVNGEVSNSNLVNSIIQVAGNSVGLGGSTNIDMQDLSSLGTGSRTINIGASSNSGSPAPGLDNTGWITLQNEETANAPNSNGTLLYNNSEGLRHYDGVWEDVITSTSGAYEIQKNGADGSGIINFKT